MLLIMVLTLGLTTVLSAKKNPVMHAKKLPVDFKKEIIKHIHYPAFAEEDKMEGEVWMKVTLDDQQKVKIVDLSATNQAMGKHVRAELNDVKIENTSFVSGNIYFMKVKFDILEE